MATATDLEQNGRDTNIINYLLGEPVELLPADNYGRLGQLLLQLVDIINQIKGTMFHYAGRVDTVEDLEEITGNPNDIYFVGPEDAASWDEYIWAYDTQTEAGHWDRLGGVTIIVDDHLDAQSTNPVQNAVITLALADKTNLTVIGPAFSDQTQYSLGNLVVKDGTLYKYISSTASTGAWDSTKWTAVTIADILAEKLDSSVASNTYLAITTAAATYLTLTDAAATYAAKSEIPDISGKANSSMIADPYDSTATYADGDLFTFEGELYKVDSVNGQYISTGNLLTSEVMSTAGGYINGQIPTYTGGAYVPETFNSRWDYRTSGYIEVTPGMTLSIDASGSYSTGNINNCDSFYNADKTRIGAYNPGDGVSAHITRSYVIPANVKYVRIGLGPSNYQPSPVAKLVRADMPKVVKVTVAEVLPDAVTVTQTGDMYIGAVCVRKVLTQAEYDLLDPPDERCDYKIVPATT